MERTDEISVGTTSQELGSASGLQTARLIDFRNREVQALLEIVRAGESASVIGVSGVGKSNLFSHLLDKHVQLRVLKEEAKQILFVHANFHYAPDWSSRTIYSLILEKLELLPGGAAIVPLHDALLNAGDDRLKVQRYFRQALKQLLGDSSYRLVILFDQFDNFYRGASEWVFSNLRGLREEYKYRLSFLVFTRNLLPDLAPTDSGREEFYELLAANIVGIRPYSQVDAHAAVERISARVNLPFPDKRRLDRYYELSGGHAGLLRAIYLIDVREDIVNADNVIVNSCSHDNIFEECNKLWGSLTAYEKKVLIYVVTQHSLAEDLAKVRKHLQMKGILGANNDIFSPVFAHYVCNQPQPWEESLYLEATTGRLWVGGRSVAQLEPTPYMLLVELLENANNLVTHDELAVAGWANGIVSPEMIHSAMSRVRRAVNAVNDPGMKIEALRGKGYCLHVPDRYELTQPSV